MASHAAWELPARPEGTHMPVHSWLASTTQTKAILDRHALATKHHLGQNFLINDAIIGKIVALAQIGDRDVVFEIGPGIGTLTVAMLPLAGAVVAVEADRTLEPVLAETCARDSERFALVMGDALRVSPEQLEHAVASLGIEGLNPSPTKLVSNLPYQVAATVVLGTFQSQPTIARAVVMVQAEVADRMAAHPGTKEYGAYTAKLRLYAQETGRFEVGPGNFMPPPHVNSSVIRLDRAPMVNPITGETLTSGQALRCAQVIDAAFAQRRKTIRNSMSSNGFDKAVLDAAFEKCGIDPRSRAEVNAPEDFVRLTDALGWE